jgi:hypothetical protein
MFYQSKEYFLLLLELLLFTFIILKTESVKLEILRNKKYDTSFSEQIIKNRIVTDLEFRTKVIKYLSENK